MGLEHLAVKTESTDFVSTFDAARILHVSPDTVRRHTDSGRIPSWRTPGGHRRYRLADIEAFKELTA